MRHVTWLLDPLPSRLLSIFRKKISLWKQTINHHPRATTRLKLTENSELYLPRDSPLSHKAPQEFSGSFGKINCRSVSQTNKSQQTAVLITQGETNRTPRSKPPNLSVSGRRSTDKSWHNKYKYHKDKSFIKRKGEKRSRFFAPRCLLPQVRSREVFRPSLSSWAFAPLVGVAPKEKERSSSQNCSVQKNQEFGNKPFPGVLFPFLQTLLQALCRKPCSRAGTLPIWVPLDHPSKPFQRWDSL